MNARRMILPQLPPAALLRSALAGVLGAVGVTCSLAIHLWQLASPGTLSLDVNSWKGWQEQGTVEMSVAPAISAEMLAAVEPTVKAVEVEQLTLPALDLKVRVARQRIPSKVAVAASSRTQDRIASSQAASLQESVQAEAVAEADVLRNLHSRLKGQFLLAMAVPAPAAKERPAVLFAEVSSASVIAPALATIHPMEEAVTTQVRMAGNTAAEATDSGASTIAPIPGFRRAEPASGRMIAGSSSVLQTYKAEPQAAQSVVANPPATQVKVFSLPVTVKPIASVQPKTASLTFSKAQTKKSPPVAESRQEIHAAWPKQPDAGASEARADLAKSPRLIAVEAFQLQQKVASATFSAFSGSRDPLKAEWLLTAAPNHVPTLSAVGLLTSQAEAVNSQGEIPAMSLSENAASILGALVGARIEAATGLVFGRIPAGWTMEFSGRSERPIYLGDDQSQLQADDPSRIRWFALVNVEPGMHLLHLVSPWSGERAVVSVPVLARHATALPLTTPVRIRLAGRLMDGSVDVAAPIKKATVKRVGLEESVTATERDGRFDLGSQLWVPGSSIDLEATPFDGFTHRYSLQRKRDDAQAVELFAFPQDTIRSWVGSLEGGVSDQSAIVVAAVGVAGRELEEFRRDPVNGRELAVGVEPIQTDGSLRTELYDLDAERRLVEATSKSAENARALAFRTVGVQVESGLQRVQVESEGGATLWSTLLVTSPGVISVVTR